MNFKKPAEELSSVITQHYHWLHRNPELSFQEVKTTKYIVEQLEKMGIEVTTFDDYNGCIAHIKGGSEGKTIMLRADIDALPTYENSGVDYASETPGIMHACGHDAHAASLLGAAQLLHNERENLCGNVELLFQSAEEGFTGSYYYADNGYLDNVDFIYGQHVWLGLEVGKVDISDGPRMASCDNFTITVHGVSAHGSTPHLGKDAIVCASSIILNLQTLASRMNDPLNPLVVSVGKITAGSQFNIITDTAVLEGTVRTFSKEMRYKIGNALQELVKTSAEALGCTATVDYIWLEAPVVNEHTKINQIGRNSVAKLFGEDAVAAEPQAMGSEDFGYLAEHTPGAFGFLGCRDESCGAVWGPHSDKFKLNDKDIWRGSAVYAQFAADYLEQTAKEAQA